MNTIKYNLNHIAELEEEFGVLSSVVVDLLTDNELTKQEIEDIILDELGIER